MSSNGWESVGVLAVLAAGFVCAVRGAFYVSDAVGWSIAALSWIQLSLLAVLICVCVVAIVIAKRKDR